MSRRSKKGRNINGVILLDKASGISSNKALQQVKHLFFANKAGHTGSLDPLASGILPICLGQATKVAQFLLDDDKRYFVRGKLGELTDTGDSEGQIISTQDISEVTKDKLQIVVDSFIGEIEQIPPMYSALKKDGQPLYKLARQGIEVERKPRKVRIHSIDFIDYKNGIVTLEVACTKGTYIRTLIEDIGNKLECGAHIVELRRVGFAHFDISQSIKFTELESMKTDDFANLDAKILLSEDMLPNFISINLDAKHSEDIRYGRKINCGKTGEEKTVKLFDNRQNFLGIGSLSSNGTIAPKRLFVDA